MSFEIKDLSQVIESIKAVTNDAKKPSKNTFAAPESSQKDSENIKITLDGQKPGHRRMLLIFVCTLTALSFIFLVVIVSIQMYIRTYNSTYNGVSDTVINILTGGVFGQSIAVVAVIASYVWKDPK